MESEDRDRAPKTLALKSTLYKIIQRLDTDKEPGWKTEKNGQRFWKKNPEQHGIIKAKGGDHLGKEEAITSTSKAAETGQSLWKTVWRVFRKLKIGAPG